MTAQFPLFLEEVLKMSPEKREDVYRADMKSLKGTAEQRRKTAKRHVIDVLPFKGKKGLSKAVLAALKSKVKNGEIDSAALEGDKKLLKNPKLKHIYLGRHGHK